MFDLILDFHHQLHFCLQQRNDSMLQSMLKTWDPDDDNHAMNQSMNYGYIQLETTHDPLRTIIHLTPEQRQLLRYDAFRLSFVEYYADFYYTDDMTWETVRHYLEKNAPLPFLISMTSPLMGLYQHYDTMLYEARHERHVGDCTSISCPCTKCFLETQLGIDTISHIPKKERYRYVHGPSL